MAKAFLRVEGFISLTEYSKVLDASHPNILELACKNRLRDVWGTRGRTFWFSTHSRDCCLSIL